MVDIEEPDSEFLKVKCIDCGSDQIIFSKPSSEAHCSVCGASLSEPTGGNGNIRADIMERL